MKIVESAELREFREQCRDWLADNVPKQPRPDDGEPMRDFDLAWQAKQFAGGWAGINWPKEYGGRGASVLEQLIWHEEYALAGGPPSGCMFVSLSHAGPTLIVSGNEEQKARYLPTILNGTENWCQGFSEPGAGSDLASLKTRGEIQGDELVIKGTKIWTTYGQLARWQELLIRTDPGETRHRGLTWVICDMQAPGLEVRPIRTMAGLEHFAQCFYDDVRIPLKNVVGEVNQGWKTAMTTLGFERGTGTVAHQIELATRVDRVIEAVKSAPGGADEAQLEMLAVLKSEVMALRSMTAASISRGLHEAVPGAEGNVVALYFGELTRRVNAAAFDLLGPHSLERSGYDYPAHFLECFKWAIGGGTSEIRRNTIGERVLGLPKGPKAV